MTEPGPGQRPRAGGPPSPAPRAAAVALLALAGAVACRSAETRPALLWEAARDGRSTYLLGTIHNGVDAEAELPRVVWSKLDAAPAFAMETDLADPALTTLGERDSGGLRDDLGPAYWAKLEAVLGTARAEFIEHKKPVIAAVLVSMRGLPDTVPMDGVLLARAQGQGKRIVYLAPIASEIAVLEQVMDVRLLKLMLDDPARVEQLNRDMLAAYRAGDDARLVALAATQRADALAHGYTAAEYDASLELVLYRRNAAWIDKIEQLHAAGGGFVAVGALHLAGPRSVLELLAAKGYTITRVPPHGG